ncbi:acyl carrier protein [Aquihabitans sp. McL0605]|uniref:acyl carrier protein n=1 Tax=Aquihabitans sp. McL0605 TaxID=3415671 RepID=UPI003CEB81B9
MITDTVQAILNEHGRMAVDARGLGPDDDLYGAGLTSHASVSLMLALEDTFDVEFPEHLLTRATFGSIGSIEDAITQLQGTPLAGAASQPAG